MLLSRTPPWEGEAAMRSAYGIALGLALVALVVAHVVTAVALLRRRAPVRAVLALLIPPLSPLFAFEAGMRVLAFIWVGAFGVYALVLALS